LIFYEDTYMKKNDLKINIVAKKMLKQNCWPTN